jgi:hypothetical protein
MNPCLDKTRFLSRSAPPILPMMRRALVLDEVSQRGRVTAPSDADDTNAAYFANTPFS